MAPSVCALIALPILPKGLPLRGVRNCTSGGSTAAAVSRRLFYARHAKMSLGKPFDFNQN